VNPRVALVLQVIRRHARGIAGFVFAVTLVTAAVTLLLPVWYRAETTLLPPQESGESFGMLANLIETSALSKVGLLTTTSTSDLYVEILKSRRVREAVVRRFDLVHRYHEQNLDACLKRLDEHVRAEAERSRLIRVSVEDKDARTAAAMANAMIEELDAVNRDVRVVRAANSRKYLEQQLAGAETRLHDAEERLSTYERAHGVVIAGSEAQAVQGVADLLSRKLALQVRRSWLESYAGPDNPALTALNSELAAVDRELSTLPGIKQEGARLSLGVEIPRRVFTLLTAQLEEARLEQDRGASSVDVLDPARAPTLRARPRRGLITIIAFAAAVLLASIWVGLRVRSSLEPPGAPATRA
jgi:uncharacterized protein involved in exopolysaccharide biosynthesis